MKRLIILLLLLLFAAIAAIAAVGCAAILEDHRIFVNDHIVQQPERHPEEQIEVSNYDELVAEMLNFVVLHENSGQIYATGYDGDVETDFQRACHEIVNNDPVSAYAVSDITGIINKIVSYYEIDFSIEYKRTKKQTDSIVNVSTLRFLRIELLNVMSDYSDEAVFCTKLNISEEDMYELVIETYYDNPRKIVMKPVAVVEIFQTSGEERIIELRLGYIERAGILRQHGANLTEYVRGNAELATGKTDAEILLSLVENLMASCVYDEGTARTISVHGAQNFAATAFGALVNGSAVGEGYAMAFKALCDELGFDCQVVLGHLDGRIHAWNILFLNGEYYHSDIAMCTVEGIQTAFLKTDADFIDRYTWDMESTQRCKGTMTYEDIVGTGETDENPDDETGEPGGQSGNSTDNESGASEKDTANESEAPINGSEPTHKPGQVDDGLDET